MNEQILATKNGNHSQREALLGRQSPLESMSASTEPACAVARAGSSRFDRITDSNGRSASQPLSLPPSQSRSRPQSPSPSEPLRQGDRHDGLTRRAYSRNDVLGAIARLGPNAVSRKEIFRRLKLTGSPISLSSVYRVIDELVRTGTVLCEWSGKREALYRIKPSRFDACQLAITNEADGRSVTIKDRALLTRLLALANQHGFSTAGGEICFRVVEPGDERPGG